METTNTAKTNAQPIATDRARLETLDSSDYAAIGMAVLNQAARDWNSRAEQTFETFTFDATLRAVEARKAIEAI